MTDSARATLDTRRDTGQPRHVPAALVVLTAAALWISYFVLVTLRWLVIGNGGWVAFAALMAPRAMVTLSGIAVTLLTWRVLRRFDTCRLRLRIAVTPLIMLPAAPLLAVINQWAFLPFGDQLGSVLNDRAMAGGVLGAAAHHAPVALWQELTELALGRYFLLIAWGSLYLALGNAEHLRAAEFRAGEYRRAAKAAELRSLRYQVNPHFLFNTLNSLSALVLSGRNDAAEAMIEALARFYRHSLAAAPTADVPLADEIALQRDYLRIESVRFPERMTCVFEVPDDLAQAAVPGMILQPLVENAIRYAVSPSSRVVTLTISAQREGEYLVLRVRDDGVGRGDGGGDGGRGRRPAGGTGIGLANVRDRLAVRFGAAAALTAGPLSAGPPADACGACGWLAEIRVPLLLPNQGGRTSAHAAG